MKKTFIPLVILFTGICFAFAQEPDTIWTQGPNWACFFAPDWNRIISTAGQCLDVTDGHIIWDNGKAPIGSFPKDSQYYYSYNYAKCRISDGTLVENGVFPRFSTIPSVFMDTSVYWKSPYEKQIKIADNDSTFYLIYQQEAYNPLTNEQYANIAVLCKYNKTLDSIVTYKPMVVDGDTVVYNNPDFWNIGYSKNMKTVIFRFWKNKKVIYRQFNENTLDSVSEFVYDQDKWGVERDIKLSNSGKYLAIGTSGGESNLGWIIIYDLTTNSIYKRFLERDSSISDQAVWKLALSRNDSFLVTNGGLGDGLRTKTWNINSQNLIHTYEKGYSGDNSLDVSPDNTKIIAPSFDRTSLLRARWTPVTSIKEENDGNNALIVYPNPARDYIEINIPRWRGQGVDKQDNKSGIRIFDLLGVKQLPRPDGHPFILEGELVRIDVSSLQPGVYFVHVGNLVRKFVKM